MAKIVTSWLRVGSTQHQKAKIQPRILVANFFAAWFTNLRRAFFEHFQFVGFVLKLNKYTNFDCCLPIVLSTFFVCVTQGLLSQNSELQNKIHFLMRHPVHFRKESSVNIHNFLNLCQATTSFELFYCTGCLVLALALLALCLKACNLDS